MMDEFFSFTSLFVKWFQLFLKGTEFYGFLTII